MFEASIMNVFNSHWEIFSPLPLVNLIQRVAA